MPGDRRPLTTRLAYGQEPGTTALHLERALARRNDVVLATGAEPVDQLLWVESGVEWLPTVEDLAAQVSGAWIIDTHRGMGWRGRLAAAFDIAFVAQFDAVEPLRARGVPCEWLPLAASAELCKPGPDLAERAFDIAFVGQSPPASRRAAVLEALRANFSFAPVTGFLDPDQMMDLYRSARIVVNVPWAGDLNMRTFEAAGARSLLVTGPARKVEAVLPAASFVLVNEDDPAAWVAAVRAALDDPDRQRRADAAYEHVVANHTYDHRASTVVDTLAAAPRRAVAPTARAAALAAGYARWGRPDSIRALRLVPVDRYKGVAEAMVWRGLIAAKRQRGRLQNARTAIGSRPLPGPLPRATR
jgi:hypothetical protein